MTTTDKRRVRTSIDGEMIDEIVATSKNMWAFKFRMVDYKWKLKEKGVWKYIDTMFEDITKTVDNVVDALDGFLFPKDDKSPIADIKNITSLTAPKPEELSSASYRLPMGQFKSSWEHEEGEEERCFEILISHKDLDEIRQHLRIVGEHRDTITGDITVNEFNRETRRGLLLLEKSQKILEKLV